MESDLKRGTRMNKSSNDNNNSASIPKDEYSFHTTIMRDGVRGPNIIP